MHACNSMARFSILINGSQHDFFVSSRSLHQGDPFSPFLFVIVMETFCRILSELWLGGHLSGFRVDTQNDVP